MITHELVNFDRADQYLAAKMAPIVPLLLYGRSARAAPTCPPGECLWYTWRDRSSSDKLDVTFKKGSLEHVHVCLSKA